MDIENAAPAEQPPIAEIGETTDTYAQPLGDQFADKQPQQPQQAEPEKQKQPKAKPEDKQPAKSPREAVERALAKAKEAPVEDPKNKDQQPKGNEANQKQEKPAEATKPTEASKPADQPGTEPKTEQSAQTEGQPQPTQESGKQNRNEAPQRFHDVAKQEWANTPESVRAEVHRSISELENGLTQYRQSHEKYEAIREYDEMATQYGTNIKDALANYTGIERLMHQDPFAALEQIVGNVAAHRGWKNQDDSPVTFRDLAAHYLNMPAGQAASRQDATMQRLSEQVATLTSRSETLEQALNETRQREAKAFMDNFSKSHPRVEELADDIALLLESGRARDLDDAYSLADRMNPSRALLAQAEETTTETQTAQTRTKAPPVNPAGAKSISGAPTAGSDPRQLSKPSGSAREALQKALRKVK